MYNIGKMPIVLVIARTMNQIIEPFLADFHRPKSFQTADQIMTATRIIVTEVKEIPML